MPLPVDYRVGTVSVTEGEAAFTGSATLWAGNVLAGDRLWLPSQPLVPPQPIVADPTNSAGLLEVDWPGETAEDVPYIIFHAGITERSTAQTRRYLELLGQIRNVGITPDAFGAFTDRAAYDEEAKKFAFLSLDGDGDTITTAVIFLKNTATDGDWSDPIKVEGQEGPEGPKGDPAILGVRKGDYSGATAYVENDIVQYEGSSWIALGATTGNAPPMLPTTANTYWQLVAAKGAAGDDGDDGVDGKFSGTEIIKTAAYTAAASDVGKTIILNKATADTLSFEAAATLGSTWMAIVKNIGAGTWTLDPDGSETIDDAATLAIASGQSMVVASNGSLLRTLFLSSSIAAVLSKTGAYTVLAADNKSLIRCDASGGAFTVALTSAATLGAGFEVSLKKIDSSVLAVTIDPNSTETIDGATTFVLNEQFEEVTLRSNGTNWEVVAYYASRAQNTRETLRANRTVYVDASSGSDTTGDGSVGAPFATKQKAMDTVSSWDCSTFEVVISCAAGTDTSGATWRGHIGTGAVILRGDTTTPSNCVWNRTGGNDITFGIGAKLTVEGFKFQTTTSGHAIQVRAFGQLTLGINEFGACAGAHIRADNLAQVACTANYTISGGANRHIDTSANCAFGYGSNTITVSGTPAFTEFIYVSLGSMISLFNTTFSGSATGKRYTIDGGAIINTYGAGTSSTYFPGNSNGTAASASYAAQI